MTTEDRLRAALDAKADTAAPSPTAYAEVKHRVSRRRIVPSLQVVAAALAAAAVAVGGFAVIQSGDDRADSPVTGPPPSASSEPSESASAIPTPARTARTTPLPGGVPVEDYVALLQDGRLVTASARTGAVTAVLAESSGHRPGQPGDLALSPDRRTIYFTQGPSDTAPSYAAPGSFGSETCPSRLMRLDVVTGSLTAVTDGSNLQMSPDGRALAFIRDCADDDYLVVRNLETDAETTYVNDDLHGGTEEGPWRLDDLVWHADSKRIWVLMDWEDAPELRLFDPATDRTLRDAEDVKTQHYPFDLERNGEGLAFIHRCCYPEQEEDSVIYQRGTSGYEAALFRSPASGNLSGLVVGPGPDPDLLYVKSGRLYRLDPDTGGITDLGPSTAVARDW